jgi:carbamoyltransferase
MTSILGISAFYHDSAAALIVDGEVAAAAQEERFSRKKHDERFPVHAARYCLAEAGLRPADVTYVAYYEKPLLKFDRLLETYLAYAPRGYAAYRQAIPLWLKQKLHLRREIREGLGDIPRRRYVFVGHHESHAASAFFPSPFEQAAILTLDGVGEWTTGAFGAGRGNTLELLQEMRFPHSLGMLYSAFTYYTGFTVNSGEYKLMGLAPYGEPRFADQILTHLIDLKPDGSFRMDMSYFDYGHGLTMTSKKFETLFGGPPRRPDSPLTERDMDLAASIQRVTEEIMVRTARHVRAQTGMKALCLAGGVALNCVANSKILDNAGFDDIWIQPAAGDAGGALGAAWFVWHQLLKKDRTPGHPDGQHASWLGPAFDDVQIKSMLEASGAPYTEAPTDADACAQVADALAAGAVVGWFQGRMEFGPRALGARSLLGDPRRAEMQTVMNVKVKFREGFRPFAPAVLAEHTADYFDVPSGLDSPYMLLVRGVAAEQRTAPADQRIARGIDKLKVRRSSIPAVTHVDYSARIQTVDAERHGTYYQVISEFYRRTGCPVLVNTSFNLGWEPIVCTPEDAFRTFMSSEIDMLALGRFIVNKQQQPAVAMTRRSAGGDPLLDRVLPGGDGRFRHSADAVPAESPDTESLRAVLERARGDEYGALLHDIIPFNTNVLHVDCGAGDLTILLGVGCRAAIGTSASAEDVRRAEQFRASHKLERVRFLTMPSDQLAFAPSAFDVVIWGAMADSGRANETLARIVPIVRPGGMLIVGGYDGLGRFLAGFRGTRSNTGSGRVSAGEAARLIARHGFTVTSVLPTVDGADAHANGLQTSMATVREGGLMLLIGRRDRWQ